MAINGLTTGDIVVLNVNQDIVYRKGDHHVISPIQGELELKVEDTGVHGADLELVRLGLYGPGHDEIGEVSLRGLTGRAVLEGTSLQLSFEAGVTYNTLEMYQFNDDFSVDHFGAQREVFGGNLQLGFQEVDPGERAWQSQWRQLSLNAHEQCLGLIDAIESVPSAATPLDTARRLNLAALPCLPPFAGMKRRLRVRAVRFKADEHDSGTGQAWPEHLQAAQRVWEKCGVDLFETDIPAVKTDPALREGNRPRQVLRSHRDQPGTILIYFVAGTFTGPGWTFGDGAAHAKCIISDQAAANVTVLAHEIGHVLDGDHPGRFGPTTTWAGDPCTVMVANGSLINPLPAVNTIHNCQSLKNDALVSLGAVCLNPDASAIRC